MRRIRESYRQLMAKYPMRTQMFTSGALMVAGDGISQLAIERRSIWGPVESINNYDVKRAARFWLVGTFLIAPINSTWYAFLDSHIRIPKHPHLRLLFRVFLDRTIMSVAMISAILIVLRCLEGHSRSEVVRRWGDDFGAVFIAGLKLWPPVQLVNFYIVPLNYRLLVVQVVALFWNTYLSWKTNSQGD